MTSVLERPRHTSQHDAHTAAATHLQVRLGGEAWQFWLPPRFGLSKIYRPRSLLLRVLIHHHHQDSKEANEDYRRYYITAHGRSLSIRRVLSYLLLNCNRVGCAPSLRIESFDRPLAEAFEAFPAEYHLSDCSGTSICLPRTFKSSLRVMIDAGNPQRIELCLVIGIAPVGSRRLDFTSQRRRSDDETNTVV